MDRSVTIGFLPRERFALAAESLASLLAHTPLPFRLVVVDPAIPRPYRREMDAVLEGRHHVDVISVDRHLLPPASKNLVVDVAGDDYLCLLENDVLFTDGWLERLLAACEEFPADVAAPVLREGRGEREHFDRLLGTIEESGSEPGKLEIRPLRAPRNTATRRTRVDFAEQHCLLYRREVFDRIGRFDEELNTRDEIDLSLALWQAGATLVLEPDAVLNYVPPSTPPAEDELPFYRQRWDLTRAEASRERIRSRWNLVTTPGDLGFVRYRNLITQLGEVRTDLERLCADDRRVLLLDDGEWHGTEVTESLPILPFPHREGTYWGFPASDLDALAELDRAAADGTTHVVVGWPAMWWFDHLPAFKRRLDELGRLVRCDVRLAVYELQERPDGHRAGGDLTRRGR